jgi:hypothetical protein
VVNGCSKERLFQLLIPRFACTKSVEVHFCDICDILSRKQLKLPCLGCSSVDKTAVAVLETT